jgi:hypothetical protein
MWPHGSAAVWNSDHPPTITLIDLPPGEAHKTPMGHVTGPETPGPSTPSQVAGQWAEAKMQVGTACGAAPDAGGPEMQFWNAFSDMTTGAPRTAAVDQTQAE